MQNTNLKDNIKGNCHFVYYRDNALWYRTEANVVFPVPISDIDQGTFLPTERAMMFMRWIKPYLLTIA